MVADRYDIMSSGGTTAPTGYATIDKSAHRIYLEGIDISPSNPVWAAFDTLGHVQAAPAMDTQAAITIDRAIVDPEGWLNKNAYNSPDWWGDNFLAKQTFILPPGLYMVNLHGVFITPSIANIAEFDFAVVDNRCANTLADSFYGKGVGLPCIYAPGLLAGTSLVDGNLMVLVPQEFSPGIVVSPILRCWGVTPEDWAASISIFRIQP